MARPETEPQRRFDRPKPNPEEQYARIAQGKTEPGEVCVPEGVGYRARAPYGALLGCVFALDTRAQCRTDGTCAAGPESPRRAPWLWLSWVAGSCG